MIHSKPEIPILFLDPEDAELQNRLEYQLVHHRTSYMNNGFYNICDDENKKVFCKIVEAESLKLIQDYSNNIYWKELDLRNTMFNGITYEKWLYGQVSPSIISKHYSTHEPVFWERISNDISLAVDAVIDAQLKNQI